MNKKTIRNTAVCYWSKEDKAFVAESPLFETIAGVGATEQEARKVFDDLLADAYEAYLEGRVPGYEKPGRPAKGRVSLNIDVKPESKEFIKALAGKLESSLGEVIDFLAYAYQKQKESAPAVATDAKTKKGLYMVFQKMHDLKVSIDHLETEWLPASTRQKAASTTKHSNQTKSNQKALKTFRYPKSLKA